MRRVVPFPRINAVTMTR